MNIHTNINILFLQVIWIWTKMQMMVKSKVCEGALICEFLILQKVFVLISLEPYIEICLYTKICTDMRTDSLMTKKSSEFRNIFCVFELLMLKIGEMPHLNAFRRKSVGLSGDSLHEYSQASMFSCFSKSYLLSSPWTLIPLICSRFIGLFFFLLFFIVYVSLIQFA